MYASGMTEAKLTEWDNIAELLGNNKFTTVVLNFFSNSKTYPGKLKEHQFQEIIRESVMANYFGSEKIIIMGKSWGGSMAIKFVLDNPSLIEKAVFIAAAGAQELIPNLLRNKGNFRYLRNLYTTLNFP
jgi:hypothetical protein